jgi:hypothetical protein
MKNSKSILAQTLSVAFAAFLCGPAPLAGADYSLAISKTNGQAKVLWSGPATLQEASTLTGSPKDWHNVTPAPTGNSYTVPVGPGASFFRAVYLTAPAAITALTCTIASGNGPFASNGVFSVTTSGSNYTITPVSGPVAASSGTFSYAASGVTATAAITDSIDGPGTLVLTFTSGTGGTYVITFAAAPGASQTGMFTIP